MSGAAYAPGERGFASDNHAGVLPEVLEAVARVNHGHAVSYGGDEVTARVEELFRGEFGPDARVALVFNGSVLVHTGEVTEGLRLLDEATTAAVSGELQPLAVGIVYCVTIDSCQSLGDCGRAAQWTDAANRWCDRTDITGFPGACRIHRAELLRLGGDWTKAEEQAVQACEEAVVLHRGAVVAARPAAELTGHDGAARYRALLR